MTHLAAWFHRVPLRTEVKVAAIAAVLLLFVPWVGLPEVFVSATFLIFAYAALSLSWNLLGGYAGYLSLAHAAFVGIGGYTVAILLFRYKISPFVTFWIGGILAALVAAVIGVVCLRIRGAYFFIATLLVVFIFQALAYNLRGITKGAAGIDLPLFTFDGDVEDRIWYYVGLALMVGAAAVAIAIEHSWFGLNLTAIREDEEVARAMGVRVVQSRLIAYMLSAGFAGVVGAFYFYRAHYIEPVAGFDFSLSAAPVLGAILGGSRTWLGPIAGVLVYEGMSLVLTLTVGNQYNGVIYAVLLILVVVMLPQGLVGLARSALGTFRRSPAPAPVELKSA
jgi:branched-chain amino acid transport system permease protein